MSKQKKGQDTDKWDWYISVGYYMGPLYRQKVYWDHYILYGTKKQAKYMYAKKTLERIKPKISLREYANETYCEEYDHLVTDDMIEKFLNDQHLRDTAGEYNDGWIRLIELSDEEMGIGDFVHHEPTVISYDSGFSFDKKY